MLACLALIVLGSAAGQEEAPTGQIYADLEPFVGLESIRVSVRGFAPILAHVLPDAVDEEIRGMTGFAPAQREEMGKNLLAQAKAELERQGVPPLVNDSERFSRVPTFVLDVSWIYDKPRDAINLRVEAKLNEPAASIRNPSQILMATTWTEISYVTMTREKLPSALAGFVRHYTTRFAGFYRRAHTSPGESKQP